MEEIAKFFYRAKPGETVTLNADITGDAFVEAGPIPPLEPVRDGTDQVTRWKLAIPTSDFPSAFVISARVDFEDPPKGSKVDFTISGSKGGSFSVPSIDPDSLNKKPDFTVSVQAS